MFLLVTKELLVNDLLSWKPCRRTNRIETVFIGTRQFIHIFCIQSASGFAKPVPKPFSFYPYGFDKDGNVIYSEYFENAFYKIYKNKKGFLYECHDLNGVGNLTQINCAYTCTEPIEIDAVSDISDLHDYYMEQVKKDLFSIKPYSEISEKEIGFVYDELKKDIDKVQAENYS